MLFKETELIGIMVFLLIGGGVVTFITYLFRMITTALSSKYLVVVKDNNGRIFNVENVVSPIDVVWFKRSLNRLRRSNIPVINIDFSNLDSRERDVLSSNNKAEAQLAINTFRAHAKGLIDYLKNDVDYGNQPGQATAAVDQFSEYMWDFFHNKAQKTIPYHSEQLQYIYSNFTPENDEFLIGLSDRLFLTSKRLILLSSGKLPTFQVSLMLEEIADYSIARMPKETISQS